MDRGQGTMHSSSKAPESPGSPGGSNVGSLDTMTSLFFHPKGGMGKGSGKKSPQKSGKFKDSGQRSESAVKVAGVDSTPGGYGG